LQEESSGTVKKTIHRKEYRAILDALAKARDDKGLTQAQVAHALKKPQSYVSKVENGERRIDVMEFLDICRAIGVDFSKLLRDAGRG
jgi:transcriptional regulator with XRE-family HTH domain